MASIHNDFKEPGTFYARANQSNQIISHEKSESVNSTNSGPSFGSAASAFTVEGGGGVLLLLVSSIIPLLIKNLWWI